MSENIVEWDFPKTLLVLGNGFDLSCNLPSYYIKFLEKALREKVDFQQKESKLDYKNIFDYCTNKLDKCLKFINFIHDDVKKNEIILELNPWYIIFLHKKMIQNSDWYLVENQIEIELSDDKNGLNLVNKIGDTLLGIYKEDRVGHRINKYALTKTGMTASVQKIYELLSYCLLHKDLNRLNLESSKEVYKELRNSVDELRLEYESLTKVANIDELEESFENKIISQLFPLVSQVLLAELKELEFDFSRYLLNILTMNSYEYFESADNLLKKILKSIDPEVYKNQDKHKFNVLSFNYTQPWEYWGNQESALININKVVNAHGIVEQNYDGIIFGIDDENISPLSNEYIFTKASRTLDLYTNVESTTGMYHERFYDLLVPTIENIVFYGHSLSKADFSYFRMIFDKYIKNEFTKFTFIYTVFKGTTNDKEKRKLIKNISAVFGEYSYSKNKNTDIFKELVQNNRIKIERIEI